MLSSFSLRTIMHLNITKVGIISVIVLGLLQKANPLLIVLQDLNGYVEHLVCNFCQKVGYQLLPRIPYPIPYRYLFRFNILVQHFQQFNLTYRFQGIQYTAGSVSEFRNSSGKGWLPPLNVYSNVTSTVTWFQAHQDCFSSASRLDFFTYVEKVLFIVCPRLVFKWDRLREILQYRDVLRRKTSKLSTMQSRVLRM